MLSANPCRGVRAQSPRPQGTKLRAAAEAISVRIARSAADAVREAELVISAVTAASSGDAAESVKAHLRGNPFFIDINSVSPGRRQDTAKLLGAAARYIDAVLAPIIRRGTRPRCSLPGRTARPSRRRLLDWVCAQASPVPRLAQLRRSRWCAA